MNSIIRSGCRLLAIMTLCTLLTATVWAGEDPTGTTTATEEGPAVPETVTPLDSQQVEDHLAVPQQVNWYSFSLPEAGSALLMIQSLQENWNGYTYSWNATVYAADRKTVLEQAQVRGAWYMTPLSVDGLDAGTYYVAISTVASMTNPLMSGFADDPYRLTLTKLIPSAIPAREAGGVATLTQAGEIICAIDSTYFVKINNGEAKAALRENTYNAIVPVLVGESKEAVQYVVSGSCQVAGSETHTAEQDGVIYYYTTGEGIGKYTDKTFEINALPLYYTYAKSYEGKNLVYDVIRQAQPKKPSDSANGGSNGIELIALGIAVVLIVVICIVVKKVRENRPAHSYSFGSSSSSGGESSEYSGSYSGSSVSADEKAKRDFEDMTLIKQMNDRLNTPGYDPESFSTTDIESFPTDVDSFPPSDSIW